MSRPVRVLLRRAEGGGDQRQDHSTHTPHGQQGSAERHSSGLKNTDGTVRHAHAGEDSCDFNLMLQKGGPHGSWKRSQRMAVTLNIFFLSDTEIFYYNFL